MSCLAKHMLQLTANKTEAAVWVLAPARAGVSTQHPEGSLLCALVHCCLVAFKTGMITC